MAAAYLPGIDKETIKLEVPQAPATRINWLYIDLQFYYDSTVLLRTVGGGDGRGRPLTGEVVDSVWKRRISGSSQITETGLSFVVSRIKITTQENPQDLMPIKYISALLAKDDGGRTDG